MVNTIVIECIPFFVEGDVMQYKIMFGDETLLINCFNNTLL